MANTKISLQIWIKITTPVICVNRFHQLHMKETNSSLRPDLKKLVNVLNRRVCGICFGILITEDNKYTLILGLWKCGTIAQLYYYIVDISARAGY